MLQKKKSAKAETEEPKRKPARKPAARSISRKAASPTRKTPAKATKPSKKETVEVETREVVTEHTAESTAKIQCFNRRRKLVCAHLLLPLHKCMAKTIAPGRWASVRIGKKRRCGLYEETAYATEKS